jgi:hypothetical protein
MLISEQLEQLGFIKGTGWGGNVVYTNPDSKHMTQVWVYLSGDSDNPFTVSDACYDARHSFDLKHFFSWWEQVSAKECSYA